MNEDSFNLSSLIKVPQSCIFGVFSILYLFSSSSSIECQSKFNLLYFIFIVKPVSKMCEILKSGILNLCFILWVQYKNIRSYLHSAGLSGSPS